MTTAVVVGSGPNGLAAAVHLARSGMRVTVYEAMSQIGGGTRSAALTLPGFAHDVCSSVHPMGAASPFFRSLPLAEHGLAWVHSPAPAAHPFDDGTVALLERSTRDTAATLDAVDTRAYPALMDPFIERWEDLFRDALAPLRFPRSPFLMARFGLKGLRSALALARSKFAGPRARALFCGSAAHTLEPLTHRPTAAFGLMLSVAGHAVGWPFARGGSQCIADALAAELRMLGGEIVTGASVQSIDALSQADAVLLDLTPREILRVAGHRLPARYKRSLERYRYGPGVFKVDWALAEPIPWRGKDCARAGTVHLGESADDIAAGSADAWEGRISSKPFVLLSQPTLFDSSRAPPGQHIAWAYCHVPHGSTADMTAAIEAQVERYAPGFRDIVLARATRSAAELEVYNPNLVGGDINGGIADLRQLFFRPTFQRVPYSTPLDKLYICSSSTPPGGAVHGMCGYHSAKTVLRRLPRPVADSREVPGQTG